MRTIFDVMLPCPICDRQIHDDDKHHRLTGHLTAQQIRDRHQTRVAYLEGNR